MEYLIENEYLTARIKSIGAELFSLRSNDVEYIWEADPKHWGRSSPVLFPIVGSLKDAKTYINNMEYNMKQHGFLRDQEFDLYEKTNTKLSLINRYNNETLKLYPFKYQVILSYEIIDKSIRTTYLITNLDNTEMSFNIGAHPGFRCPLYKGEVFTDYSVEFSEEENFTSPFVSPKGLLDFSKGRPFKNLKKLDMNYEYFEEDAIVIKDVKSDSVKLVNKLGKGIKFSFPGFKTFAIWSAASRGPFVCLEPWIGYADSVDSDYDYNKKDNLVRLESNNNFNIYYDIEVI